MTTTTTTMMMMMMVVVLLVTTASATSHLSRVLQCQRYPDAPAAYQRHSDREEEWGQGAEASDFEELEQTLVGEGVAELPLQGRGNLQHA
jgi:hypothetical protein